MIKDQPDAKPRSPSLESFLAKRRQRQSVDQIAHEIVNQLTVLNLVGSRIIARSPAGADAKLAREVEIFERSIAEATVLVQQLVNDLQSQKIFTGDAAQPAPPVPGQVIRFLRGVSGHKR